MKYKYNLSYLPVDAVANPHLCSRCGVNWLETQRAFLETRSGEIICTTCVNRLEETDAAFAIGSESMSGGQE